MPFSFGGSKSKSSGQSQSTSSSLSTSTAQQSAFNQALSDSVSGGFSRGGSESISGGQSQQTVAFEDVFQRLFGNAEQVVPSLDASSLTSAANQLFSSGTGFLDSLGGGADYLQNRLGSENPLLGEQIDRLGLDINEYLAESVLPTIRGNAVAAGTLGGGRQGVAEGLAAEGALDAFSRGVTELRAGDVASRDAIAQGLVGQQGAGLSAIPGLAAVADMGFGAALSPYERLAGILGGPMALTQSSQFGQGSSFSTAEDFARAFSQAIGGSQGTSASRSTSASQSTSKTKGKGSGISLGFK